MRNTLPSVERIREILDYDPETGVFRWKVRRGNMPAGSIAGSVNTNRGEIGYRNIFIEGKLRPAHRVAWLLCHGQDPGHLVIDHINRDTTDNRIANLRIATFSENSLNSRKRNNCSSKMKGVDWNKNEKKWRSRIHVKGKSICLGYFATEELAAEAYKQAAAKYHGEFARFN
jgi:hypothetical protein